ncbi:ABC transporter permease [Pseudomonas sp. LRF_L74]|uniref:ABC transporter permease n=1 Tax=Pseudomonas sp. LRF_L74 TaxID=3369422 RepID=UPI003F6310DB
MSPSVRYFCQRFRRNRGALLGLAIVTLALSLAFFGPLLSPHGPWAIVAEPGLWPGQDWRYPLGSDNLGRDILSGLLHGCRTSFAIGISAALLAVVSGTLVGLYAGQHAGSWQDNLLMRLVEVFQSVPSLLLAMVVVALFQPSMITLILAIALGAWPDIARLVRQETLRLRRSDFVVLCSTFGMSPGRILLTQILPNCSAPLLVMLSVLMASSILIEAGLSFLGLGDPSAVSWGGMVAAGRDLLQTHWYQSLLPGLAILLLVCGISLLSEGIGESLGIDPRSREVRS